MNEILKLAKEQHHRGVPLANISRLLNIRTSVLEKLFQRQVAVHTECFDILSRSYDSYKGRLPTKAPGTYGLPSCLATQGQCCYPLWGDAEVPTPLSLVCGEPVEDKRGYCQYHQSLCYSVEQGCSK